MFSINCVNPGTFYIRPLKKKFSEITHELTDNTIRNIEIEGLYDLKNRFRVDQKFLTFHSPDIEFDEALWPLDFHSLRYREVGKIAFEHTLSDIDILLDTPAASSIGAGFVHASYQDTSSYGIVSGLFFDDVLENFILGLCVDGSGWLIE